ncbi:MAG: cryptochrome/photolyase family protein [Roseiflexaceae bacterium]
MSDTIAIWILGDQLLLEHPALAEAEARVGRGRLRVVLVESAGRIAQLPYQRKKLVLLLSAMRHYAEALRERGYSVDLRRAPDFASGLRAHIEEHRPVCLITMAASEYATRQSQQQLGNTLGLPVELLPNRQFLVEQFCPFPNPQPGKRYVMEQFYRAMRRHFGVLIDSDGGPAGGEWNYDKQNRQPLPRSVRPPDPPRFPPDAITQAVIAEVEAAGHGVGTAAGFDLPVTHEQARAALEDFIEQRLADFGPYEDAMSSAHPTLYHSLLSPPLNIGLLEPLELVRAAEAAYAAGRVPLNSAEGFIRQVLGWREYIYWQYWQQMPALRHANGWQAHRPMPRMFWDGQTDMRCIRHVVERLLATGYSHHIERLMLVCNFCLLAGVDPAAVAGWFLAFYVDAYDWVVLPNVIGMGLNADGGRTATKPYIASANYINKMSDYCAGCRFNPKQRSGPDACPYNLLYWNFLLAHEPALRANPRLGPNVLGLAHLDEAERQTIRAQARAFLEQLPLYEAPTPQNGQ